MSADLLIDNSAWVRLSDPSLPDSRAIEIGDDFDAQRVAVCLPFLLEAGFSAVDSRDHSELQNDLLVLPFLPIEEEIEQRALDAQAQLARAGHHRLPPADLIIGALADRHEIGVLHYEADFDVLLAKTDLDFESVWLMPRGSL